MGYSKQSQIDIPQCPNGHGNMQLEKKWKMKGRNQKQPITIELWRCPQCRTTVRIPRKGETKQ